MPQNKNQAEKIFHNPDYDPEKSHHRPDGFVNRHAPRMGPPKGLGKWAWKKFVKRGGRPPRGLVTGITPDLNFIHHNRRDTAVTWIGHSTILLQLDGVNFLTDPQFSKRASPFGFIGPRRHQPPGVAIKKLPHIDYVLISHNHYDHLDVTSLRRLMRQKGGAPRLIVPLGIQHWLKRHFPAAAAQCVALDWDDRCVLHGAKAPISINFLAVQHWSARGLDDRYQTLWGSYAVLHPDFRFWFSGDLGYSPDTQAIGASYGPFDLAAIAIGAYEPRHLMESMHINPTEAVAVMNDVRAKRAFGIHWGTFENLTDEPLDQPPRDLAVALAAVGLSPDVFFTLKHGETWRGATGLSNLNTSTNP
ncbi:MAG: MBL fold metallo-hydrolase [Candidatus Symbiobacter sp.]|nr:MBL fold metallo-hydrolase [Candidatus Symbiobacter sp.]